MTDASFALPDSIDIAVIGAGTHALTVVTHLLQKRKSLKSRLLVFDANGWMQQWNRQFAQFEIPHLRSPAVHHPDPDPFALRRFAESRSDELFTPYDLPGTRLFQEFCQEVVQRWQLSDCVYPAQVARIEPVQKRFRLWLSSGETLMARRVVLAIGGGKPQVPAWVEQITDDYPIDRLCHSSQIDLRGMRLTGERILIVGGGLTSGHLAIGAIERGAQVMLMSRRCFYDKLFDADPGWLGPKYLKGFQAETCWHTRASIVQQARNGGSMTPAILTRLRRDRHSGRLTFYEQCQIADAHWTGYHWQVCCDNQTVHECIQSEPIDRIWLATGSTLNLDQHPLLNEMREQHSIEIVNGLPVLDSYLRWPGHELY